MKYDLEETEARDRKNAAVHEAGHAVASLVRGERLHDAEIMRNASDGS